jgi:hypothetical protein
VLEKEEKNTALEKDSRQKAEKKFWAEDVPGGEND